MSASNLDISHAIKPKSDQLNADDLITGPITIKIRNVTVKDGGEQRISVFYHGDNDKPWKPCVTQARLIAGIWGSDARQWIERSLTLYRNPKVKWGGVEVGGIEVSHMSHIDSPVTVALTKTKGVKKPHQVKPLAIQNSQPAQQAAPAALTAEEIATISRNGDVAAAKGSEDLRKWWGSIGAPAQKAIGGVEKIEALKKIAAEADAAAQESSPAPASGGDDDVPFDV